jgi:hypothetical protein
MGEPWVSVSGQLRLERFAKNIYNSGIYDALEVVG